MKRFLSVILGIMLIASLTLGLFGTALAGSGVVRIRTLSRGASLRDCPDGTKIGSVHMNTELEVFNQENGWFYVYYNGKYGWVAGQQVEILEISTGSDSGVSSGYSSCGSSDYSSGYNFRQNDGGVCDMGVPYIGNTVFRENMMNMVVYWVQTQLKATGVWYQGYQWDVTGSLGDHTMSEIRSFMQSNGYRGHTGVISQEVIDALAAYMGDSLVPVYMGGFYNSMDNLLQRDSWGTMSRIVSNMQTGVARETLGARWIQCILSYLGYYRSGIDGKYGEGTENAVKQYQADHGFQQRDYVTLGVARSMLEQYYYAGGDVNRLP